MIQDFKTMRWIRMISMALLAAGLAGCGGGDDGTDSARQLLQGRWSGVLMLAGQSTCPAALSISQTYTVSVDGGIADVVFSEGGSAQRVSLMNDGSFTYSLTLGANGETRDEWNFRVVSANRAQVTYTHFTNLPSPSCSATWSGEMTR